MADPKRIARFLVDESGNRIPIPEDPFEGVGIKGPTTFMDRMKNIFSDFAIDPNNAIPAPMELGMVMNPKNATALANALKASLPDFGETVSPAQFIINYMKLKYPMLTNKVKMFPVQAGGLGPGTRGAYYQNPFYQAFTNAPTMQRTIEVADQPGRSLSAHADTAGHELTHLIQDLRGRNLPNVSALQDFDAYINSLAERQARQGGMTASRTFRHFLDSIPVSLENILKNAVTKGE